MFGYIRTDTPEMRVRENEYYRAVYCGLCRAQGKCTGQCSRMTLSYDIAFLALLRLAIAGENPEIKRGRCIAHPLKKRAYLSRCEALDYCAYVAAILTHGKIVDDLADERGSKKLKARLIKPIAKKMRKKALKTYRELDEKVAQGLRELSEIEKRKLQSVDIPADKFGEILAEVLSYGVDENSAKILKNIGKHIGRWIYIVDAVDDIEEDAKKGRFNPLICLYGEGSIDDDKKRIISDSLKLELLAAEPAFELIDHENNRTVEEIINNIIYRGMPNVADEILGLKCTDKKKRGRDKNG